MDVYCVSLDTYTPRYYYRTVSAKVTFGNRLTLHDKKNIGTGIITFQYPVCLEWKQISMFSFANNAIINRYSL